jgi:cytochrome c oxidase subunit II
MSIFRFLPTAASTDAPALDAVLASVHTHIFVLGLAWSLLFVWLLVRFRRRSQPVARYQGISGWLPAVAIGAVIVGDVVILATSALPVWASRTTPPSMTADALEIRVVAEQFAWHVHYPGKDGRFGATRQALIGAPNPLGIDRDDPAAKDDIGLSNVLTVPTGRLVVLHLSSRDVVHGFTLLEMRVKVDATPGMTTRTWFTATHPGEWQIGCSQLCGLGHYRMQGNFSVLSPADWDQWLTIETAELSR